MHDVGGEMSEVPNPHLPKVNIFRSQADVRLILQHPIAHDAHLRIWVCIEGSQVNPSGTLMLCKGSALRALMVGRSVPFVCDRLRNSRRVRPASSCIPAEVILVCPLRCR